MTKTNDMRTKRKQQNEANAAEAKSEVIEWMKTQFTATAKSREIIEEYYEGIENTGERNPKN